MTIHNTPTHTPSDNSIIWPPNDGFVEGTEEKTVIPAGYLFSRYGKPSGAFLGDEADSFESRSFPPHSRHEVLHVYRLLIDYEFMRGVIAPWFDQPGGGTQYLAHDERGNKITIQELLNKGILEEIT